jgi:predicted DNA-binding transcriptional regulator YafY
MRWWQVAGLDRGLGVDRTLTLRAESFDAACNRAAEHGIVVYTDSVAPLTDGNSGERRVLESLVDFTRKRRLVKLTYVKLGEITHTIRVVEVYHLLEASTGLLVYCAQVNPQPDDRPWRNFRLDRIIAVEDGGNTYSARMPTSIDQGELRNFWTVKDQEESGQTPTGDSLSINLSATKGEVTLKTGPTHVDRYVSSFLEKLDDSKLQARDRSELGTLAANLKKAQVKVAHARILAHLLDDLASDGDISAADNRLIKRVMSAMYEIGWAPTLE